MILSPSESSEYIVQNADYVRINNNGIIKIKDEIINGINSGKININNFSQGKHHPKSTDAHAIEWIFVVDTLNFCFWTPDNFTKYKVEEETGYFALCAAINRAIKDGIDLTSAKYYSKVNIETLLHVFRSDDGETKIPLINERIKCLNKVGEILLKYYDGRFENCIKESEKSAEKLLQIIIKRFPCFRDEAEYKGKRVSFYKRAQILIGDIWSCFRGEGLGQFFDIDKITMFADYRVPQVLIHFGALEYTQDLLNFLEKNIIIQNGDPKEVEIRGASIYIVEEVKKQILSKDNHHESFINSILIDHFLWDYRRKYAHELENIPFHKVLSIYY